MNLISVTLFIIISNILHLVNSKLNIIEVDEGDTAILACYFNIANQKKDDLLLIWKYPDEESDSDRINYNNVFYGRSIFSHLKVKNATRSKDEGKYICSLYDIDVFLIEKEFKLIIDDDIMYDSEFGDEDVVDGPINSNKATLFTENTNMTEHVDYNFIKTTTEINSVHKVSNTEPKVDDVGQANNKALIILCVIGVLILQFGAVAICILLIRRKRRRNLRSQNAYR